MNNYTYILCQEIEKYVNDDKKKEVRIFLNNLNMIDAIEHDILSRGVDTAKINAIVKNYLVQKANLLTVDEYNNITARINPITILKNPNLLDNVLKEYSKRIVREENNIKTIFLVVIGGIYVINKSIFSFSLGVNSESGAGKDHILNETLRPFRHILEKQGRISPTALTYWHNTLLEPNWSWDGKILYLADISDQVLNSGVLKVFLTDENKSTITVKNKAIEFETKGKPVFLCSFAESSLNKESERRVPLINLDESNEQTKLIMQRIAELESEGISPEFSSIIGNALTFFKYVNVHIPYAKKLPKHLPTSTIMRTNFPRFLDYIKASACLYQYQRETKEDGTIIANGQDYENAKLMLLQTTSNRLMIPLDRKKKKLLETAKRLRYFTTQEMLNSYAGYGLSQLYIVLSDLQEMGFLNSTSIESEHSRKPVRHYTYIDNDNLTLPSWSNIQNETE